MKGRPGRDTMQCIENVNVFTEDNCFHPGTVWIEGKRISRVELDDAKNLHSGALETEGSDASVKIQAMDVQDGHGMYLIPGMIDLHFHGCLEYDFSDGTMEAIDEIAGFELAHGVTSICPATMTLPVERLEQILKTAARYRRSQENQEARATLVGIHMEGPFISKEKCGAQNPSYIQKPSQALLEDFLHWSEGLVKIVGVAPEKEGAVDFISRAKDKVTVAIAHSNATYDEAMAGIHAGASHGIHLFNGMTSLGHREPGIPGAVFQDNTTTAELICDGVHLHPAVAKMAATLLGADRTVLISDSIRGTGFGAGRYLIGDLEFEVKGNRATLVEKGALAGSVTPLPECFRMAVKEMGIPLTTAVAAVTHNPSRILGIQSERGFLQEGCYADMVLLDQDLTIRKIWKEGRVVSS